MPYKSKAQAAYFHANKAKLEAQGVNVAEWDAASKGMRLPARAGTGILSAATKRKKKQKIRF